MAFELLDRIEPVMSKRIYYGNLFETIEDAVILAIRYAAQERGTELTVEEEQPFERAQEALFDAICAAVGSHDIENDQCGMPAHRYCVRCNRRESALGGQS